MRPGFIRRAFTRAEDRGNWVTDHVLACPYPSDVAGLAALAGDGVTLVVNLDRRRHDPADLARHALAEIHLPVRNFTAPTPRQLEEGVAAIVHAVVNDRRVAVHCGSGLGRSGTLVACYLVEQGHVADEAIALLRALRPGSVETFGQVRAVKTYERWRKAR